MVGALAPVEPLPSPLSSRLPRPAVGPKRRDLQFNGPLVETRNTTSPAEVSSRPERSAVEGPAVSVHPLTKSSIETPPSPLSSRPERSEVEGSAVRPSGFSNAGVPTQTLKPPCRDAHPYRAISLRTQHQNPFRHRLHFRPAIKDRKILPPSPKPIQVTIVSTTHIPRLPRTIQPNRVIPILSIRDNLERPARNLVIARPRSSRHSKSIPAPRIMPHVELILEIRTQRPTHRAINPSIEIR